MRIDADPDAADAALAYAARDEAPCRLGELALVDGGGRIGPLDTDFWDDADRRERRQPTSRSARASTGPWARRNSRASTRSERHLDFMIGSPPRWWSTGITRDGTRVPVLRPRRLADLKLIKGAWLRSGGAGAHAEDRGDHLGRIEIVAGADAPPRSRIDV